MRSQKRYSTYIFKAMKIPYIDRNQYEELVLIAMRLIGRIEIYLFIHVTRYNKVLVLKVPYDTWEDFSIRQRS